MRFTSFSSLPNHSVSPRCLVYGGRVILEERNVSSLDDQVFKQKTFVPGCSDGSVWGDTQSRAREEKYISPLQNNSFPSSLVCGSAGFRTSSETYLSVEVSVLILVQDWNKYRYRYLITSIYKHQYCPSLVKPSVTHTHTQLQREHTLSFSLL